MTKKNWGSTLILILGSILLALLLCVLFLLKPWNMLFNPQVSSSSEPTQNSSTPSLIASLETKPTVLVQTKSSVLASKALPSSSVTPTEAPWPEPTARDGRTDLSFPFTKDHVILVNRKHPVNAHYIPKLAQDGPMILAPEALHALKEMMQAARTEGVQFFYRSGYRSFDYQVQLRRQYLRSDPGGEASVDRYSAPPGASEHQTGLAVDLDNGNGLDDHFDQTPAGKWLHDNAYKFGFILRFLPNKEAVTGYYYEPWHFRYVGKEIAAQIGPHPQICLEEYLQDGPAPAPNYGQAPKP